MNYGFNRKSIYFVQNIFRSNITMSINNEPISPNIFTRSGTRALSTTMESGSARWRPPASWRRTRWCPLRPGSSSEVGRQLIGGVLQLLAKQTVRSHGDIRYWEFKILCTPRFALKVEHLISIQVYCTYQRGKALLLNSDLFLCLFHFPLIPTKSVFENLMCFEKHGLEKKWYKKCTSVYFIMINWLVFVHLHLTFFY